MYPHREAPFHTGWWSVERLIPILLLLLLIAVIVWAVVRLTRQPGVVSGAAHVGGLDRSGSPPVGDPAMDLVRQRYARGELDRETFLQTVQDLSPGSVEAPVTDPPPPDAP